MEKLEYVKGYMVICLLWCDNMYHIIYGIFNFNVPLDTELKIGYDWLNMEEVK